MAAPPTRTCTACAKPVAVGAAFCTLCGHALPPVQSSFTGRACAELNKHPTSVAIVVAIIFISLSVLTATLSEKPQRSRPELRPLTQAEQRAAEERQKELQLEQWVPQHQATILAFQPAKPGLNADSYLTIELASGDVYEVRLESGLLSRTLEGTADPTDNPFDFIKGNSIAAEVTGNSMKVVAGAPGSYREYAGSVIKVGR